MYNIFLYEWIFLKTQNLSTSMFFIISYNRIFMKHLFLQIVFISIPEKYDPVPWTPTLGNHGTMLFHLKEEPLTSYTHTRFILDWGIVMLPVSKLDLFSLRNIDLLFSSKE